MDVTNGKKAEEKNLNNFQIAEIKDEELPKTIARESLSAVNRNSVTARDFSQGTFGDIGVTESVVILKEATEKLKSGDLTEVENMLMAQALSLDAIYTEMARRARLNMGSHLAATETYMRMALKAQSQSRTALEALVEVKYPKATTFVRQQNVAYQQQVNNEQAANSANSPSAADPAHEKNLNQSNELLEANHGERLDTRAQGKAGGNDSTLETVGKINRRKNNGREGKG